MVYLFDPESTRGNAQFAFKSVRLKNPSDSVLETGPVTVFGDGRFIGEGMSEPIPARAIAFVPFALDRQIVVERKGRGRRPDQQAGHGAARDLQRRGAAPDRPALHVEQPRGRAGHGVPAAHGGAGLHPREERVALRGEARRGEPLQGDHPGAQQGGGGRSPSRRRSGRPSTCAAPEGIEEVRGVPVAGGCRSRARAEGAGAARAAEADGRHAGEDRHLARSGGGVPPAQWTSCTTSSSP